MKKPITVGEKRGRWTTICRLENKPNGKPVWECRCDCGTVKPVLSDAFRSGSSKSCGCLKLEKVVKMGHANGTHGMSKTPTGRSWQMMMARCFNPNFHKYQRYGARGISVCQFLKTSPRAIVATIGERPSLEVSIERIDNDSGYNCGTCPECIGIGRGKNIRWATIQEQNKNRSSTVKFSVFGKTLCLSDWAKVLQIDRHDVAERLGNVWRLQMQNA